MAYSLKHKVVSWISRTLFDGVTYTVRNGINKGLKRRGGLGWLPFGQMNPELAFWNSLDLAGKVVYDIGAFHGLLTIHFANKAKQVVAWEPTAHNRRRLEENVVLNRFSNVIVRPYALGSAFATAEVSFDPNAPGTASADSSLKGGGRTETIEVRTLDAETGIPPADFIKIDTEGFELEVLKGAALALKHKPDLFLEMHGATMEDKEYRVRAIAQHLWDAGYTRLFHVESEAVLTRETVTSAAQGHIYARA